MHDLLREHFVALWERINARGDPDRPYRKLVRMYRSPRRSYHTLEGHILHCLQELEEARPFTKHSDIAPGAILYHDAVMGRGIEGCNELWSAGIAVRTFRRAGCNRTFRMNIASCILATRHWYGAGWTDGRVVMDADLAILGQPEGVFDRYETQIREEYAHVPLDRFQAGRTRILQQFLRNYSIYQTPYFRERYEQSAIKNIRRSIDRLAHP
ncbi:MAG: hypothetical protein HY566_01850 [Candidatus Kerfeldbacteria bacterium]|nr:hypothetical protein [Candidatus Kerfeldbacteria bacterium]